MVVSLVQGIKSLAAPLLQPLFLPILYLMIQSLGTITNLWTTGDRIQDEKDFMNPTTPPVYDFIIGKCQIIGSYFVKKEFTSKFLYLIPVGAGSAGSLLANRLSRHYTVLLLEAGGEPNPLQFIPGFGLFLIGYPELDWQHRSVPQRFASLNSINQVK